MGEWIAIRNWRRFQNYKDRNPPWVRWYTDQLDDDDLRSLKPMTRLFWSQVVLVSSRKENVIPNDAAWLAQEMAMSRQAVTSSLKELEQAGFLRFFASKDDCIAASNRDSASRDARTETETETEEVLLLKEGFAVDVASANGAEPEWPTEEEQQQQQPDFNIPELREMPT